MKEIEKITYLKQLLHPETPSDEELKALLLITKGAILNKRYPQGFDLTMEVPSQYEFIQLQMCVQLYNKRGVEGQIAHSENGISRTYEDIDSSLLNKILPMCGSVVTKGIV